MRLGWHGWQRGLCGPGTAPCGVEERLQIKESESYLELHVMKQWGWVSGIFSTQTCQQCALDVQRDNWLMCCGCVGSLAKYFKSAGVIAIQ